jgi:hypothetical protein
MMKEYKSSGLEKLMDLTIEYHCDDKKAETFRGDSFITNQIAKSKFI